MGWGIIGAVIMRAVMVGAGALIVSKFHGVLLLFALLLLYQGGKIAYGDGDDDENEDLENNYVIQLARHLVPVSSDFSGEDFTTTTNGKWTATPLLLTLVAIEFSDVVFAIDSVPAAFGVSESAIVIYTANMFAILSLRSIYTVIAQVVNGLPELQKAIGIVLVFIGAKMLAEAMGFNMETRFSLFVVVGILGVGAMLSLKGKKARARTSNV